MRWHTPSSKPEDYIPGIRESACIRIEFGHKPFRFELISVISPNSRISKDESIRQSLSRWIIRCSDKSESKWVNTYHNGMEKASYPILQNTNVFFGMKYPSKTSSSELTCGRPRGTVGLHLNDSFHTALRYRKLLTSSAVGCRPRPTTRSISSWILRWTSGWTSTAAKKFNRAAVV